MDLAENTGTMSDEMYKIFDLHNSSIDVTIETFLTTPIPEDRKMVQELIMKSLEERKGGDFDFRTITSSGEIRWIHEKSTIELDDKGNPKRVFGTCQDITESKLAELQLKESERRTKALLNANPDMIFRMNSEGIYLDYKADSAELYAQSEVSIIGKKNRDITPPEFADLIDRYIRQTLDSGELQEFEYQMITLKRGLRDYEARMVPSGKDEVITVVRDITDRKRAEDELNISEMKFRNIVEGTKAILFSTNRRGIFTYLNEAACKILEMTNHELLGKFYLKFVHPSSRAKTHTIFTEQIENPTPNKSIDVRIITKSGKEGWLSFLINPIYMEGKIVGLSSVGLDITKRKHIEYALRESEAKLTDAMKIAKLSTWEYDCVLDRFTFPDQSFSLFNTTAEQEGGYTMSSGQFAQKYIYPDDREMIAKELRKALETPDPAYNSYMEYRVIYAPGEIGYFSANIRIEKDVDNRTIKALGVNQDITDRKRMEETILRINKAVESSSDAICMSDSQGHHFYHNKAFTEIFEYTIEEIEAAGGGTAIYVNNDVGQKVFDIIMGGGTWNGEVEMLSKSGRRFDISLRADAITDANGVIVGLVGMHTDITERKSATEALRESEENFRSMFENNSAAMVIAEPDTMVSMVNDEFCKLSGYTRQEIIGTRWTDQISPEDRERLKEYNRRRLINANDVPDKYEFNIYNKKGEIRHALMSVTMLKTKKTIGSFVDITDRKQAEEEIKRSNKELIKLNTEKDKFFSIIAHDLKSPFNGFLNLTALMADKTETFSLVEFADYSKSLNESARSLYKLLENLLEWAQIQKGAINFNPKDSDLSKMVSQGIETIYQRALQKRIKIINEIYDIQKVYADEKMIRTVLRNLLSNAIKFTRKDGKTIINSKPSDNETIEVSIEDNGVGISEKNIKRLFKIEEKVSSKGTDGEPSTGLGLTAM